MYPNYNMYNQFYNFDEFNYRNEAPQQMDSGEVITLNQAINLIRKSVGDEREDELFYDNLIKLAPTEKEKQIIRSIRDDERKHREILRKLYYDFTGQMLPLEGPMSEINRENMNYKEQLEKALFGELDAVVKYRKIMGTMPSGSSYTLLMSIMTDEIRHANKYNFLIHNAK